MFHYFTYWHFDISRLSFKKRHLWTLWNNNQIANSIKDELKSKLVISCNVINIKKALFAGSFKSRTESVSYIQYNALKLFYNYIFEVKKKYILWIWYYKCKKVILFQNPSYLINNILNKHLPNILGFHQRIFVFWKNVLGSNAYQYISKKIHIKISIGVDFI